MPSVLRFVCTFALFCAGTSVAHAQGIPQRVAELEARLAALEAASAALDVSVDCAAGGSLATALAQGTGRSAPMIVRISGVCTEHIVVTRDDVTLVGIAPGAGLAGAQTSLPVLAIRGAQRVRLIQLTITGGSEALTVAAGASASGRDLVLAQSGSGLRVSDAVADFSNTIVEHNTSMGAVAVGRARLSLSGGEVRHNGFHGVFADEGSVALRGAAVHHNGGTGVFGWRNAPVLIMSTEVRDNGSGVGLQAGASLQIGGGSVVSGNTSGGIGLFVGSRGNAMGAVIEQNGQVGINVHGGSMFNFGSAGNVVRANGGDGVHVSDTSVVGAFPNVGLQITQNQGGGIRCDPPPAVAQIATGGPGLSITLAHVFGNTGLKQIDCPGF